MNKVPSLVAGSLVLLAFAVSNAHAQSVSWKQLVGIIPASNVVGTGTGAVPGGFLPWTTTSGSSHVNLSSGEIDFVVRGLVFAGGGAGVTIGTPGPVTSVKGTLMCDVDGSASGGNSVLVDTDSVPLSATGDAKFSGRLDLPSVCSTESDIAFLVRVGAFNGNPVNGPWIANGAVLTRNKQ